MHQLIQIAGALLILSGFVLAQFRVLDPQSLWYLVVNLLGSAILTVDAWREAQWGFFLLELGLGDRLGVGSDAACAWANPPRRPLRIR